MNEKLKTKINYIYTPMSLHNIERNILYEVIA